jgi:hypothetical protein
MTGNANEHGSVFAITLKKLVTLALAVAALALLPLACGEQPETAPEKKQAVRPAWAPDKRPLVFSRSQTKYNYYKNYLNNRTWLDRPLLFDRALGPQPGDPAPGYGGTFASFRQDIDTAKTYGLDGLAVLLGYKRMAENGFATIDFTKQAAPENFSLLIEFSGDKSPAEDVVAYQAESIRRQLACPDAARLDGKIAITSYVADGIPPEKWREILAGLRREVGDSFVFLADVACPWVSAFDAFCKNNRVMPEDKAREVEASVRSYLETADGVMFNMPTVVSDDERYDRRPPRDFFENFVIPLFLKLRNDPAYAKKYFGVKLGLAYINHMSGVTKSEACTKTLRYGFETALRVRPDVMQLAEWNEVNENTCFMPTVAKSFSTQRILKYYMHVLRNEAPAPNPGDDISLPNLILSYRPYLRLGEPLEVEVLNIPDGTAAGEFSVGLELLDENGRTVKQFPGMKLPAAELKDVTWSLPTENFPDAEILRPVLTVKPPRGKTLRYAEGLQAMRIHTTWNIDYLCVKQPLRDLIQPQQAEFASTAEHRLRGAFACGENLAALEVLEDDGEIYGAGRENEYPSLDTHTLFRVYYQGKSGKPFTGKVTIKNTSFKFLPPPDRGLTFHSCKGDSVSVNFKASVVGPPVGFFLAVPKAEAAQGELDIDFNLLKGNIALKTALDYGMAALTGEDGISLVVQPWTWLPDIPARINAPKAEFDIPAALHEADAVYHMRAVTVAGKTWRSAPVIHRAPRSGQTTKLTVFSETRQQPVDIVVAKERVPDLTWDFNPAAGGVLPCRNSPRWNGQLGGAVQYGETFHSRAYPEGTVITAPAWATEDGFPCLKFDGRGNFAHFPTEAFPRGSFTLSFEIKPTSEENQVLFTHHGSLIGSLSLFLNKGAITGTFVDTKVKLHRLDPRISVKTGEWSKVEVIYDYRAFRVKVNGREGTSVPLSARALYMAPCVFGGRPGYEEFFPGAPRFFQGYLKAFGIAHGVE